MGDAGQGVDRPATLWAWRAQRAGAAGGPGAGSRIRRDLIVLAASLVVFAGCAVIAASGRVGPAERAVFHAINALPGWLYRPMLAAQYLGVLAMPLVVAAGALVWRRWRLAAALVLVVPCKLVLEQVAKALVQRQRPGTTVPDALLRGVPHQGLSFTSGHAIITFAIAGLLVLVLPRRWGVLAVVLAACNGLARVYLGAHNPLDVVGGAAIGLAIAAVLDMILDVARDRGRPLWQHGLTREDGAK
ncbi:MAG: phosphatase PAP2 family protein [Streptosporangiaceae bacterium]